MMRSSRLKRAILVFASGAAVAGVVWLAWPQPLPVDLATAVRGSIEVTVDDEAKTRVRHVYTVSAPVAGKVLRTSRHVGDQVIAGETIVAVMQPTAPTFLDVRTRGELQAAVAVAEAAVRLAEAEVRRIEAALDYSRSELRRVEALSRADVISPKTFDKAKLDVEMNEAALSASQAQLEIRRGEQVSAAARLIEPSSDAGTTNPACCVQVRAPVTGRVLKLIQESESIVPAGASLIEIGDPLDLEVAADLLSTHAVQITPGSAVRIDGWGGPTVTGKVTRIEPAGFLKVSALGIEEQRVRIIIDFVDPPEAWSRLGHEYRVNVHVTVWRTDDALTVPVSALFRKGDDWAVFAVKGGRAQTTLIQIGRRNSRMAQVLSGLAAGEAVILHPSDRIREGSSVSTRER